MHQTASRSPSHPTADLPIETSEPALTRNAWYSPVWFETASRVIEMLPRDFSRWLSSGLGQLGYTFCHTRRAVLMQNLEPLVSDPDKRDLVCRNCFRNFLWML